MPRLPLREHLLLLTRYSPSGPKLDSEGSAPPYHQHRVRTPPPKGPVTQSVGPATRPEVPVTHAVGPATQTWVPVTQFMEPTSHAAGPASRGSVPPAPCHAAEAGHSPTSIGW